jgi:hypothetical protein
MTRAYAPKNEKLFDQGLNTRREVLGSNTSRCVDQKTQRISTLICRSCGPNIVGEMYGTGQERKTFARFLISP